MTETTGPYGHSRRLIDINLDNQRQCPFCGSQNLCIVDWADDDGEYDAIECCQCKGCAPATVWNRRHISL